MKTTNTSVIREPRSAYTTLAMPDSNEVSRINALLTALKEQCGTQR